ncbi:MAG: M20 family metallopeptidase [Nitrospinae bacterium]|nr:M20 family metallopeptidase [Nitrospinota bacterium]
MIGAAAIRKALEARKDEIIDQIAHVVNIDSPTFPSKGTNAVSSHFAEKYRTMGADVEMIPGTHETGDHLLATFHGKRETGPHILLIGHCDTVFPEGIAAQRPFTMKDGIAYGPGVADMKGCLVTCQFMMEALLTEGFEEFGKIGILYDTDEERGNPSSRNVIERIGKDAAAALIIESGRANGSTVSSRKGSCFGRLLVSGVSAHAGVDPEKGRSAVHELAHQMVAIQKLEREGGTVNITGLSGGHRPHIVADEASCHVEVRAERQAIFDSMTDELRRITSSPHIEGTRSEFQILGGRPVMEFNAETEKLVSIAAEIAEDAGVEFMHAPSGGGSDGNYLSPLGVAVLDGLGPVGGNLHTDEEYLELESIAPRGALLGGLIERLSTK